MKKQLRSFIIKATEAVFFIVLAVALLANLYKFGVYAAGRSNCMLIIVPLAAAAAAFRNLLAVEVKPLR